MKKILSFSLVVLLLITIFQFTALAATNDQTKIIIDSKNVCPEQVFDVDVKLSNNPGIVSANMKVSFGEDLELVSATPGDAFSTLTYIPPKALSLGNTIKSSCQFVWTGFDISENDIKDGIILTLRFKISKDAEVGSSHNIRIFSENGDVIDKNLGSIILENTAKITVSEHSYTNACDTTCNVCGLTRNITHQYKWVIDKNANCGTNGSKHEECSVCGEKRNLNTVISATNNHIYDNDCDDRCNVCNQIRAVSEHFYENECDNTCNVCGESRNVSHNYKWIIDKSENCSEDGIKHQECIYCGESKNENTVIFATGNHSYIYGCDTECSECGATREASHSYKYYTTVSATTSKNGKKYYECSECGAIKTTTIYMASKCSLSTTTYTYNGSTKKPSVKIYDSKGDKLTYGEDYTYKRPSSSKYVGKYTIKVTFIGDYSGTKNLYYTINPPKTTVSSLTAGKKSLKVKLKKQSSQTTGYEIQYSTSKSFKSAKVKKVSSYKTTTVTLKSLSAKKTYYVRVRTYKTVNGKKYYSAWSSYKYKKTK